MDNWNSFTNSQKIAFYELRNALDKSEEAFKLGKEFVEKLEESHLALKTLSKSLSDIIGDKL